VPTQHAGAEASIAHSDVGITLDDARASGSVATRCRGLAARARQTPLLQRFGFTVLAKPSPRASHAGRRFAWDRPDLLDAALAEAVVAVQVG
jgi:hypothetical protein